MTEKMTAIKGAAAKSLVVNGLRAAILGGEMSPGQRLVELELASKFGVTRGGVRRAIDDLVAEGLVDRIPNRGARVRVVSIDEAVSLLECRQVLEGRIAARAAPRLTKPMASELEDIGQAMQRAVKEGDLTAYAALNVRLHNLIADISEQRVAAELIERLKSQMVRHQFKLSLRPGRPQVSLAQHLAIIRAVVAGDAAAADKAAQAHVGSVIAALLSGGTGQYPPLVQPAPGSRPRLVSASGRDRDR